MDIGLLKQKEIVRLSMRQRLAQVSAAERAERSRRLVRRLLELPAWRAAARVMSFAPLSTEPDLDLLWRVGAFADKQVAYPRMEGAEIRLYYVRTLGELESSRWSLREPRPSMENEATLDDFGLVLVPGMAFDTKGGRLGRGGGYYDRLLARRDPARTRLVGVGFAFQLGEEMLPSASHDVRVDEVCTD